MSDARQTDEYALSADPSGFTQGMNTAAASARQTAQSIQSSMQAIEGHLGQVSKVLSTVTGVFKTMTAVAAGGAAFKEIIGQSIEWTSEAKKLSTQLGVTTERASVMMVAMRRVGLDADVVGKASTEMTKKLGENGQAFEKLGVKVKDSSGQYRPTMEVMADVNEKLKAIKNPIEQNIAGMKVYGESWNEVKGILKLTSEAITAAEQKAKDLGLVVGEQAVADAKKYKESLGDMKMVITSLEVQAGKTLLPTFVKLGAWLSGVGPTAGKVMGMALDHVANIIGHLTELVTDLWSAFVSALTDIGKVVASVFGSEAPDSMDIFANCLKVIETAVVGFKVAVQLAIDAVLWTFENTMASATRMANVASKALRLDFQGARKAWHDGAAEIEDIQRKHLDKILAITSKGRDQIADIWTKTGVKQPEIKDQPPPKGGPTYDWKEEKGKPRTHEWEAKLAADKDAYAKQQAMQGTAMEYSMAMERDYWKRILDSKKLSAEEKEQVERKYYTAMAAIRKEQFETEIAGEKVKFEEFKNNHLERLAIANQIYEQNVARFGAESKEAKAALAEVYREQRAHADQVIAVDKVVAEAKRNAELAGIDVAEQSAEQQLALHQITADRMLDLEQQFEMRRYQIRMQALQAQEATMQGPDRDPVALAQLHAQIETLEQQHQMKLTQIKNKATLKQKQAVTGLYGTMQSGMANVISSTAKGTMSITQALFSMTQTLAGAVIDMGARMAAEWAMNLLIGEAASKATAVSEISANAGIAGAAATASAAAIPMYGWAIAPEAGMAASAAAMAYMPMASAAGGYDIPAGVNPIVQTHAEEMILPAKYANVIRDMAGSDGGGNGQTIHYHDHSGRLSPAEIRRNAGVIASALKDYAKK
jgi:hypothetical protein